MTPMLLVAAIGLSTGSAFAEHHEKKDAKKDPAHKTVAAKPTDAKKKDCSLLKTQAEKDKCAAEAHPEAHSDDGHGH